MIVAGIDVGFSGAICIMGDSPANHIVYLSDMPIIKVGKKNEFDDVAFRDILEEHEVEQVWIEKAQAMPGQGIVSTGRYLEQYGRMRGICVGLRIPYQLVHPKTWKGKMLRDMPKEKGASIVKVKQLYPDLELPFKKDHGKCDAVLICLYGMP